MRCSAFEKVLLQAGQGRVRGESASESEARFIAGRLSMVPRAYSDTRDGSERLSGVEGAELRSCGERINPTFIPGT